jgi:hypothetical protein
MRLTKELRSCLHPEFLHLASLISNWNKTRLLYKPTNAITLQTRIQTLSMKELLLSSRHTFKSETLCRVCGQWKSVGMSAVYGHLPLVPPARLWHAGRWLHPARLIAMTQSPP